MTDAGAANISSNDLDQETAEKLKGDAIGDTLYSQSFVLKTLLHFSDLKWSEEIEEDLCFLWDMTVEREVCQYLFEISFPSIACSALERYEEKRFIEIVIGILANILCANCNKSIKETDIKIVLNELDTDDIPVLIQVVRFISAITFMHNKLPFITKHITNKLVFILSYSLDKELLIKTLDSVSKLTQDFKLDSDLVDNNIYEATLKAFDTVFSIEKDTFDLGAQEKRETVKFVLEIITNLCAYNNKYDLNVLLLEMRCRDKLSKICNDIVLYYAFEENLYPVTQEFCFYISAFSYIFPISDIKCCNEMFVNLCKIFDLISIEYDKNKEDFEDVHKSLLEVLSYQIHKGEEEILYRDIKTFSKKSCLNLLNSLEKQGKQLDFDISQKLDFLKHKFK